MNKETMLDVYEAVINTEGYATPAQICEKTGLSDSYVRKIAKHLKHLNIFSEHYIKKRTCYGIKQSAMYYIMDASHEKYEECFTYLCDERFKIHKRFRVYISSTFPPEVRLTIFILKSFSMLGPNTKQDPALCCLVRPEGFTKIDWVAIRGMVHLTAGSVRLAKRKVMAEHFYSMLALFEKKSCKNKKSVL